MTATPLVTGEQLDPSRPETGVMMGQTLARLPLAMACAEWQGIPAMAAREPVIDLARDASAGMVGPISFNPTLTPMLEQACQVQGRSHRGGREIETPIAHQNDQVSGSVALVRLRRRRGQQLTATVASISSPCGRLGPIGVSVTVPATAPPSTVSAKVSATIV